MQISDELIKEMDILSPVSEDLFLGETVEIPVKIEVQIPEGYCATIRGIDENGFRGIFLNDVTRMFRLGTIGEITLSLYNHSNTAQTYYIPHHQKDSIVRKQGCTINEGSRIAILRLWNLRGDNDTKAPDTKETSQEKEST